MEYNRQAIRELVNEALTPEEFNNLVFDYFPDVDEQFTEGQTKSKQVLIFLRYTYKQRRIDDLLDKIKEINPQVFNEFQSRIRRSDTNSSNVVNQEYQAINELKEDLQKKFFDKLKSIYLSYCPKKASQNVTNIDNILDELNRFVPNQKYRPLIPFVVIIKQEIPDLEIKLQNWLDLYGRLFGYGEFQRAPQKFRNKSSIYNQNGNSSPSYLLIYLKKINSSFIQVQSWFCSDKSCRNLQEKDVIQVESTESEFHKKYYQLSEKITKLIQESNIRMAKIGSVDLSIELFLGIDLLTESDFHVEWLKIKKGRLTTAMCQQYTVNFRLAERLSYDSQDLQGSLERKWANLNSNDRIVVDYSQNIDYQLELNETVGIKLDRASNQAEFFEKIYLKALPIALWSRRDLQTISCQNEINRILNSEAVQSNFYQLPKEVKNERNKAVGKEHIGHHICLLWDDPNRMPPNPRNSEYALNSI